MEFKLTSVWIQVSRQRDPDIGGWSCSRMWRQQQAPTQTMPLHTPPDPRCLPSSAGRKSLDLKHNAKSFRLNTKLTIWRIIKWPLTALLFLYGIGISNWYLKTFLKKCKPPLDIRNSWCRMRDATHLLYCSLMYPGSHLHTCDTIAHSFS